MRLSQVHETAARQGIYAHKPLVFLFAWRLPRG